MFKSYNKSKGNLASNFHHHPPTLTHLDNMTKTTSTDYKAWKVYSDGKQKGNINNSNNCLSRRIASKLS
jgi:hypothetical protein